MISAIENKTEEIFNLFSPVEGLNTVYYGKIGNGKTRNATADIIELCNRGEVVYANWNIDIKDYDERLDKRVIWAKFLGGSKYFFKFKKDNFHYFDPQDLIDSTGNVNIHFLSRLVGVHIFVDEGQWVFNSLERYNPDDKEMVAKLKLVLHGRHYCRSLNIITQRPSNISKNMRSQVAIWYRCVKKIDIFGFMIFQCFAIQDMKDDMPVEYITDIDKDGKTIRDVPNGDVKNYFVNKRSDVIFPAYNTHAMRAKDAILNVPDFDVFETDFKGRFGLLMSSMFPRAVRFIRTAYGSIRHFKLSNLSKNKDVQVVKKSSYLSQLERSSEVKSVVLKDLLVSSDKGLFGD